MQEKKRRSNPVRTQEMKARLIAAARGLFVEKGFAATGTPEIVRRADVTRGALYHHFADKAALFDAVVVAESQALAEDISRGVTGLQDGSRNFFAAMSIPGRARLLLIEGPTVLGHARMDEIDAGGGRQSLTEGLTAAMPELPAADRDALAIVLSAAFDRAALAISQGEPAAPYEAAMSRLMDLMT